MTSVRFDEATRLAHLIAAEVVSTGQQVVLVRDVIGRYTFVLDDRGSEQPVSEGEFTRIQVQVASMLGPYAAAIPVACASSMFEPSVLDRASPDIGSPGRGLRLLENTVVGGDWSQVEVKPDDAKRSSARVAVYGFKGGVGRSTATAVLARHLAESGHVVLVVDLDLESPGVLPLVSGTSERPKHGIVDHLVEYAVGTAGGLDLVADSGYLSRSGKGALWIAPARGSGIDYRYVAKLNRIYGDLPGLRFSDRLGSAVAAAEAAVAERMGLAPSVVLLDSRAGIHDIAAAVISRIADHTFLFAGDTPQTWEGYGDLFQAWNEAGDAPKIRERLRVVASMVPQRKDEPRTEYLRRFREKSWDVFSILYDEEEAGDFSESFSPSPDLSDAPHSPIPILFNAEMVNLDPATANWWSEPYVEAAYSEFLSEASSIIDDLVWREHG